jgi:hypothetical protein
VFTTYPVEPTTESHRFSVSPLPTGTGALKTKVTAVGASVYGLDTTSLVLLRNGSTIALDLSMDAARIPLVGTATVFAILLAGFVVLGAVIPVGRVIWQVLLDSKNPLVIFRFSLVAIPRYDVDAASVPSEELMYLLYSYIRLFGLLSQRLFSQSAVSCQN